MAIPQQAPTVAATRDHHISRYARMMVGASIPT